MSTRTRLVLTTVALLAVLALGLAGCSEDDRSSPTSPPADLDPLDFDHELAAGQMVKAAGWQFADDVEIPERVLADKGLRCLIHDFERVPLTGDIVLYSWRIRVGCGENDFIGLHRVVRERRPYRPIRTREAAMIVHGAPGAFLPIFITGLYSANATVEGSFPVYLAQEDIDVWGIDMRWAIVPADVADPSFASGWNTDVDVADVRKAFQVARTIRLFTGSGLHKMNYLGYSYGSYVGYAFLNEESQRPRVLQQAKGFVNVDFHFKTDDPGVQAGSCAFAQFFYDQIEATGPLFPEGAYGTALAQLALTAPDEPSADPGFPGMTNFQAALAYGSSVPDGPPSFVPDYHLVTGEFNADGIPTDLRFTDPALWLDFISNWSPFYSTQGIAELLQVACDDSLPYDDHLGDIEVPVLYVGAGGGFGEYGLYTLELLGSSDITTHLVDVEPAFEDRIHDYGHVDIFSAPDAPEVTWSAIRGWLLAH